VRNSWTVWEQSPDPGGLPRYPIKSMILVGFALLLLQALVEVAKSATELKRSASSEPGGNEP
jgi:TRAP-type mannitol/chloroaromatic compound transport system permease small subunit